LRSAASGDRFKGLVKMAAGASNGVHGGGRGIGGMIEALRSKYGLEKGGQYLVVGESGGPGGLWKLEGGRTVPKPHLKEGGWRWVCDAIKEDEKKRDKRKVQDGEAKKDKKKKQKKQDKNKKDRKRGREDSREKKGKKEKGKGKKDSKEDDDETSNGNGEVEAESKQRIRDGDRACSSSSSSSSNSSISDSSDRDSSRGGTASNSSCDRSHASQQRRKRRRSNSPAPSSRSASSRSVRREDSRVEVDELGRRRRPRSARSVSSASDSRRSEHDERRSVFQGTSTRYDEAALLRGPPSNGGVAAPASGGDVAQGEDPLDAYMAGIASQAERDLSQVKRKAKAATHVDPSRRRR